MVFFAKLPSLLDGSEPSTCDPTVMEFLSEPSTCDPMAMEFLSMWLNGGEKSPLFRSCKDKTNLFGVKPKGAPSTHRGNVRRTRFFLVEQ
jgi:hypothetical protein